MVTTIVPGVRTPAETLQEMEKQLEADRKQRSIRQRAAKRGAQTGKDEKKKSSEVSNEKIV